MKLFSFNNITGNISSLYICIFFFRNLSDWIVKIYPNFNFQNERGQVDVWSEKCLPPGTVHLRLPRVVPIAKRLEIDFAPAMVGFEFRNGRSFPVFEGIVVCAEFKDAILEVN